MKIIDHEIKRYVLRVRAFKKESEELEKMVGHPEHEKRIQALKKDEVRLAVMVKK